MRAIIQGIRLWGSRAVYELSSDKFSYRNYVYCIHDFSGECADLDKTSVQPLAKIKNESKQKRKKKERKKKKRSCAAILFSNKQDCPDVKKIFSEA
jgi:hypothetical protein